MENTAFRNCKFNSLCCFFHFVKFFYTNLIRCFKGVHFVHFTVYNLTFNFIYLVICKDSSDFIIFIQRQVCQCDMYSSVFCYRCGFCQVRYLSFVFHTNSFCVNLT